MNRGIPAIFALALALAMLSAHAGDSGVLPTTLALDPDAPPAQRVERLLDLASYYQGQGFKRKALAYIHEAERIALVLGENEQLAVSARTGAALADSGRYDLAEVALERVLNATSGQSSRLRATALNDMGRIHSALSNFADAQSVFKDGLTIARSLGDKVLEVQLLSNWARTLLALAEVRTLLETLDALQFQLSNLPQSSVKSGLLVNAADLYRSAYWYFDFPSRWMLLAAKSLSEAAELSRAAGDMRQLSYATGYLGRLYEDEEKFADAMRLTREAAFYANSVDAYESAYVWQWQMARIYRKQGKQAQAIENYERAIVLLEHVRQELIDGSPYTFNQKVQPLFSELSDILLASTQKMTSAAAINERLHFVQRILEQAKSAEMQDYFQNECVLPESSVGLGEIEAGTAIVYPVLLPDRVELLVNLGSRIHQFTSRYDKSQLENLVNEFRDLLQVDRGDDEYLELASELYDLLIAPAMGLLEEAEIHTLLFVPDGVLRTIPLAALYDGQHFLVERYAMATTPGLTLTLPMPLELTASGLFAGGISESVQGFSALPGVPEELRNLGANYGASVISDAQFLLADITKKMASDDYSIVHIATHGHFDRNPQKSFLLAYDDKLTMNLLEQSIGRRKYVGEPLELLVLSACETAAGDSRAALGLAGVALKAGARSAVATLWQISDAATVELIERFYENVSGSRMSKAKALQQAQISLIKAGRFAHPTDWAPFLLIGNWL